MRLDLLVVPNARQWLGWTTSFSATSQTRGMLYLAVCLCRRAALGENIESFQHSFRDVHEFRGASVNIRKIGEHVEDLFKLPETVIRP